MIAVARQSKAASNITYLIGDARDVGDNPDWKGKFDKVVSFFVLHWIPFADQPRTLKGIVRCLKPGGEGLVIVDKDNEGLELPTAANLYVKNHEKWGEFVKGYESPVYMWNQSIPDTVQLLKTFGCSSATCEIKTKELRMSEVQTKLFLRTSLGEMPLIPAVEHEAFLDDLWQWAVSHYQTKAPERGYICLLIESVVIHFRK
ncbi:juvenile hormone acid O-methyltransferase-like [Acanthaster planci]|uniref:Juvenile hormone acid O-methyltransferase-like n=1 Tax=Acanthaster planci TaxID=133434 RepID=A0A8B7ZWT6_ACAPL|nr:juvenile hormone acid O-methyltransferase-like [Acanthaster planci]